MVKNMLYNVFARRIFCKDILVPLTDNEKFKKLFEENLEVLQTTIEHILLNNFFRMNCLVLNQLIKLM